MWLCFKFFLAYPAFWSSKIAAYFRPEMAEESGWDGELNLSCMYRRGYIFGACFWVVIIVISLFLLAFLCG